MSGCVNECCVSECVSERVCESGMGSDSLKYI